MRRGRRRGKFRSERERERERKKGNGLVQWSAFKINECRFKDTVCDLNDGRKERTKTEKEREDN